MPLDSAADRLSCILRDGERVINSGCTIKELKELSGPTRSDSPVKNIVVSKCVHEDLTACKVVLKEELGVEFTYSEVIKMALLLGSSGFPASKTQVRPQAETGRYDK